MLGTRVCSEETDRAVEQWLSAEMESRVGALSWDGEVGGMRVVSESVERNDSQRVRMDPLRWLKTELKSWRDSWTLSRSSLGSD